MITTINPATGKPLQTYETVSATQINAVIDASHTAFQSWRLLSFDKRAVHLNSLATLLEKNKANYARLMTEEMGKPIKQATAEIEKCAAVCRFYADYAEEFLKPDFLASDNSKSYVDFQPLGVVFAIMPWNFPFWQIFRFGAASLMAGNTLVLKHAPCVTGCALAIQALFNEAEVPANIFTTLVIDEADAHVAIEHRHVRAVTFTGSMRAGKIVGAQATGALKKVVLELGGSDPYVILKDADVAAAATACVMSRLNNAGQVCVAAKRFIVVKAVRAAFEAAVMKAIAAYPCGNPLDDACVLGPLARRDLRDLLHQQIQKSVEKGATLMCGGEMPSGDGFYYPVTVLTNVKPGMPAYEDELFGPVLAFIDANDEDDAIRIANDTVYGLGAAVFTANVKEGEKIARDKLDAGVCAVNRTISSDFRLPFGGTKCSGFGRELSVMGIKEFTNPKTVLVA